MWRYLTQSSTTLPSGGNGALSRFNWRKVWNGVKCNFSSAHHHVRKLVQKLSIRRVRMWNFTRIGCKTKKLRLLKNPAWRRSHQPPLGQPKKGVNVNRNFSWTHLDKHYVVAKLSISEVQICSFSRMGQSKKNYSSLNFLHENLEKFRSTELYHALLEGSTIFFSPTPRAVHQWKAVD